MAIHPQTSTLSFYCASLEDIKSIVTARLSSSFGASDAVFDSLEEASAGCAGRILVIDRGARADAHGVPATSMDVLNLEPYVEPKPVTAAGGFVTRRTTSDLELLLIYRRGRWDLPKGKCNAGETIASCARREVEEEVGIRDVRIIRPLGSTVHAYREGKRLRVKTTHWFEMATDAEAFTPQAEEEIKEVRWMPWADARRRIGFDTLRQHMDLVSDLF